MKLSFYGADQCVTGSCHCLEVGGKHILIDCGLQQGRDEIDNASLPFHPGQIDYVLVTHAHIDHSGRIPLLIKQGFQGRILTTRLTADLLDIMLQDSAHIQESDAEYKNRKNQRAGRPMEEPLYTVEDAMRVREFMDTCEYGQQIHICDGVDAVFIDAGHLLGSASIELWITEGSTTTKLVFSGDIGNLEQPIIKDPTYIQQADYVFMESTYGDRNHAPRPDYVAELAKILQRTFDRGGNVVVPSFAVGRTQEMLYFLREIKEKGLVKGHGNFPVYIDSPLATEATRIFRDTDPDCFDEQTRALLEKGIDPINVPGLRISVTSDDSRMINTDRTPKVILSASGMCDAGRIRHHLKHNLWRPESLILFVGYQSEGTLGRMLYDGAKEVKLFGETIAVRAEVTWLPGVSGHADKNGLLHWISGFEKKPAKVFVNHGDDGACTEFTRCLKEEHGFDAFAPYSGTSYDLAKGEFVTVTEGVPVPQKQPTPERRPMNKYFAALVAAAEALLRAVKGAEGRPNKELKKWTERIEALTRDIMN